MKNKNHVNLFIVKVYLLGNWETNINLRSSAICLSAIEPIWPGCQVPAKKDLVTKLHGYKVQNGGPLSTYLCEKKTWATD